MSTQRLKGTGCATVLATLSLLAACGAGEPPPAREEHKALQRAIQEPQEKARAAAQQAAAAAQQRADAADKAAEE